MRVTRQLRTEEKSPTGYLLRVICCGCEYVVHVILQLIEILKSWKRKERNGVNSRSEPDGTTASQREVGASNTAKKRI